MIPTLQLADEVRWADEVAIEVGAADWHLEEGYVFPVETGDGAPAGFVFVGAGRAGVTFAEPGEAVAFAAALTAGTRRDDDLAVARRAVDAGAWADGFDTALILGDDPPPAAFVRDLPEVSASKDGVVYVDAPPERYDVFVTAHRLGPARARAKAVLARRLERLAALGVDPRVGIALDAEDGARAAGRARWVAEIHGERRWLPLIEPASPSLQDGWLSFGHDPSHAIDDRYADTVFVHGLRDRPHGPPERRLRVITGVPVAAPALGARIAGGTVNVRAVPTGAGGTLAIAVDARLSLVTDVPTRVVAIAVPREPSGEAVEGLVSAGVRLRLGAVTTADGRPLTPLGVVYGPWHPGDRQVGTWRLPEPLHPGEALAIDVAWTDRWPASHPLLVHPWAISVLERAMIPYDRACVLQGLPEWVDLGPVAASRPVVPRSWVGPAQFPVDLRVVVPPGWAVAAPGATERDRPAGDGLLTRARTTGTARISIARGRVDRAAAVGPFPEVRVLTAGRQADAPYAPLVRAVLNFYRTGLPPFPAGAVEVVTGPQAPRLSSETLQRKGCVSGMLSDAVTASILADPPPATEPGRVPIERRGAWVAPAPGQIVVAGVKQFGAEVGGSPDPAGLVERGVAHALAWQWFGGLELGRRDAWIGPAAAGWLRDRFVAAAMAPDEAERWRERARDELRTTVRDRNARTLPLTEPLPYRGEAGARVLEALAAQVGERALLKGLDAFLRGETHTTEALERAVSEAAGADLTPFFDLWVRAGIQPEIAGTWEIHRGDVRVVLESDVPVGRIEVPVGVVTRSGVRRSRVVVVDGRGEATLPVRGAPLRVEIDPDGVLPLRKASIARVGPGAEPKAPDGGGGVRRVASRGG